MPGASGLSFFLSHSRAGLRDIYFRSVGDSHGVSEKQWQSFLVHCALVNLSVNEDGGHISWMNYRTSFAASRKPSCRQIDGIRIHMHAFCYIFACNCAKDVLREDRYTAVESVLTSYIM